MTDNLTALIQKFDNEKIKGLTDLEQVQVFNALKYLEIYQKIGTIAELMDLKNDKMELRQVQELEEYERSGDSK